MGVGTIGLEPDGLAEFGDRRLHLPRVAEQKSEGVTVHRMVGLEPEGRAESAIAASSCPWEPRESPRT